MEIVVHKSAVMLIPQETVGISVLPVSKLKNHYLSFSYTALKGGRSLVLGLDLQICEARDTTGLSGWLESHPEY